MMNTKRNLDAIKFVHTDYLGGDSSKVADGMG
jgi:hypothetical protein